MAIFSGLYVLLSLFELRVLIGFGIFIMSVYGILYFRWKNIREKGKNKVIFRHNKLAES